MIARRPVGASWRGKSEPERREPLARTEKSTHRWSDRSTRPGADQPSGSRPFGLIAGLVAFAACLGLVIWLIWMINPPRPAGVLLLGADYATNLAVPHNALGYRGLKGIERLSRAPRPWTLFNPARLELIHNPNDRDVLETADDWQAVITSLKKGFGEPTLILVLALNGGSDSAGAYLMPNQLKRPEDRLDMKAVIASMKELPPEKAKILVVEGARSSRTGGWACSTTISRVRLKELEPEIRAVPNLWVLSGCDEDQRCWSSEGLGRTIFHYYITEALRGGGAAGSDGRLSLEELYRYVRENVRAWAWTARGAVQEPVLIPGPYGAGGAGASQPSHLDPTSVHLATVETRRRPRLPRRRRAMPSPVRGRHSDGSTRWSPTLRPIRPFARAPTGPHSCGTSNFFSPALPRPPSRSASSSRGSSRPSARIAP